MNTSTTGRGTGSETALQTVNLSALFCIPCPVHRWTTSSGAGSWNKRRTGDANRSTANHFGVENWTLVVSAAPPRSTPTHVAASTGLKTHQASTNRHFAQGITSVVRAVSTTGRAVTTARNLQGCLVMGIRIKEGAREITVIRVDSQRGVALTSTSSTAVAVLNRRNALQDAANGIGPEDARSGWTVSSAAVRPLVTFGEQN